MFKGLEHPSAFPSMLRSTSSAAVSQSQMDIRVAPAVVVPPLNKRGESYASTATLPSSSLRRRESFGSTHLHRRDSYGSAATLLHSPRRDSFGGSTLSRGDSLDLNLKKRDSFNGAATDLRRQSFGSSLYLRPDSAGQTNLIRRDSFGSQNLRRDSLLRASVPRDYVATNNRPLLIQSECRVQGHNGAHAINGLFADANTAVKQTNSILRKDSVMRNAAVAATAVDGVGVATKSDKENSTIGHKLTVANLTKHVTILEENMNSAERSMGKVALAKKLSFDEDNLSNGSGRDRKNSYGSTGSYLASRRISIDSLEQQRRNSCDRTLFGGRRGSQASSSVDFERLEREAEESEVFKFKSYIL